MKRHKQFFDEHIQAYIQPESTGPLKYEGEEFKWVFLAIPKNGLCTFTEFFNKHGWIKKPLWQLVEKDPIRYTEPNEKAQRSHFRMEKTECFKFFSTIRNPHSRHTKGIVEQFTRLSGEISWIDAFSEKERPPYVTHGPFVGDWIVKELERNPALLNFVLTSSEDQHSIPVTSLLPPTLNPYSITWIPIDYEIPTEELINLFFLKNNIRLRITKGERVHVSDPDIKRAQNYIEDKKKDNESYWRNYTPHVLGDDMYLYNHVISQHEDKREFLEMCIRDLGLRESV
tara:strand:- start:1855 stop:2709 length:855 start_codon:yes stop_codon:yes gene_type:complete